MVDIDQDGIITAAVVGVIALLAGLAIGSFTASSGNSAAAQAVCDEFDAGKLEDLSVGYVYGNPDYEGIQMTVACSEDFIPMWPAQEIN